MPDPLNTAAPSTPAPAADSQANWQNAFTQAAAAQANNPPAPLAPAPQSAPDSHTQVAAPPTTGVTAPSAAPLQPNPLITQARSLGVQVPDGASDAQVNAAVMQRVLAMQQAYQPQQPPQAAVPQPPQEPEWSADTYFKSKWDVPEWTPQYQAMIDAGMVEYDQETGVFQPASGFELMAAPVVGQMTAAYRGRQQQVRSLLNEGNPFQRFHSVLEEPLRRAWKKDIEELVEQRLQNVAREKQIEQFEQQHKGWLYQQGPSGEAVPTAKGQQFINEVQRLMTAGIKDQVVAIQIAQQMVGATAPVAAPEPAAPATPATVPFRQPAAAAAPAPAPESTFLQDTLRVAAHNPVANGGVVPSDSLSVQTQGDIENVFRNAYRRASATG